MCLLSSSCVCVKSCTLEASCGTSVRARAWQCQRSGKGRWLCCPNRASQNTQCGCVAQSVLRVPAQQMMCHRPKPKAKRVHSWQQGVHIPSAWKKSCRPERICQLTCFLIAECFSLGACRAQFPWQLEPLNVNSRHHHVFETIASKLKGGSLRSMHGMAVALESNAHLDLVAMDLRGGSLRVCNSLDVSHACICPVFSKAATNPE
jgi:hypothetical protein